MKELSIEEKAKRYDEALEKARQIHDADRVSGIELTTCEEIFPELTESEDERIRKGIIATIHLYYGEPLEDEAKEMIAWLENLCEHKKFIDSIQVGDKVTRNQDGVLVNLSQLKRVAKKDEKQAQKPAFEMKTPEESLGIDSDTYNKIVDECIYGEQKPAWSEEDEAVLDALTRHLEGEDVYVSPHLAVKCLKSLKDRVQPQPRQEWSEEDEMFVHGLIRGLSAKRDIHGHTTFSSDCIDITETINWLKSLKNRVQPKQEWSMYDETILKALIDHFEYKKEFNEAEDYDIVLWLKSLRPQNRWKPSEEQMEALDDFIYAKYPNYKKYGAVIKSLYQDLKKLKE